MTKRLFFIPLALACILHFSYADEPINPPKDTQCKILSWQYQIWECSHPKELYFAIADGHPAPEGLYSFHLGRADSLLNNVMVFDYRSAYLGDIVHFITKSPDAVPDIKKGSWQKTPAEGYLCQGDASQCPWKIEKDGAPQDYIHTTEVVDKEAKNFGGGQMYWYLVGNFKNNRCTNLRQVQIQETKRDHDKTPMRLHGNLLAEKVGLNYTCAEELYSCSGGGRGIKVLYHLLSNGKTYTGTEPNKQIVECSYR